MTTAQVDYLFAMNFIKAVLIRRFHCGNKMFEIK